jgi:hypothetical protein
MSRHSARSTQHAALRRVPLDTVPFADHKQPRPSIERVQCARCEKTFLGTAVVTGPVEDNISIGPRGDERHDGHLRHRRLYCDFCNHIQHWLQACDAQGIFFAPTIVLQGPGFVCDSKSIADFLKKHPEAAGVEG